MAYDVTTVKLVYHFTESKHVFQPKCKFSFARLLRSLRSYWEDVKCKSNIFWVLDFKSFLTPYWFKKLAFRISLPLPALLDLPLPALLSPASRTPPAPYSPGLPPPCPPPLIFIDNSAVWNVSVILTVAQISNTQYVNLPCIFLRIPLVYLLILFFHLIKVCGGSPLDLDS